MRLDKEINIYMNNDDYIKNELKLLNLFDNLLTIRKDFRQIDLDQDYKENFDRNDIDNIKNLINTYSK